MAPDGEEAQRLKDRASALRAEAGRLRDQSMRARNPLRAVWLHLLALDQEKKARLAREDAR